MYTEMHICMYVHIIAVVKQSGALCDQTNTEGPKDRHGYTKTGRKADGQTYTERT